MVANHQHDEYIADYVAKYGDKYDVKYIADYVANYGDKYDFAVVKSAFILPTTLPNTYIVYMIT